MKLTRCEKGHFYDADKYAICPHCSGEALKDDRRPDRDAAAPVWRNDDVVYVDKLLADVDDWRDWTGIEKPIIRKEDVHPRLKIVRCENGHFYNGAEYDACPYCSGLQQGCSSVPDARLEEKPLGPKFAQCKNGHTYNRELYARCPVCEKDEQEKRKKQEAVKDRLCATVTYCENGHFYDGELYASCPVCEKAEREKREEQETGKEQLPIKLMRCGNGHFYNGAKYNDCPYCSDRSEIMWTDSSVPEIRREEKKNEGHKELRGFWHESENGMTEVLFYVEDQPNKEDRPKLKLMCCENGHFYDGNKYAVCPHCGSATQDDDDKKTII